jgi:hypothetical protein
MAQILSVECLLHRKALIIEDTLGQITDPFVGALPVTPFSYENGVLFVFEKESLTHSSIENALEICFSAVGLSAFLLPEGLIKTSEKNEITNPKTLFKAIETIIVGIYDNETFVMTYPR